MMKISSAEVLVVLCVLHQQTAEWGANAFVVPQASTSSSPSSLTRLDVFSSIFSGIFPTYKQDEDKSKKSGSTMTDPALRMKTLETDKDLRRLEQRIASLDDGPPPFPRPNGSTNNFSAGRNMKSPAQSSSPFSSRPNGANTFRMNNNNEQRNTFPRNSSNRNASPIKETRNTSPFSSLARPGPTSNTTPRMVNDRSTSLKNQWNNNRPAPSLKERSPGPFSSLTRPGTNSKKEKKNNKPSWFSRIKTLDTDKELKRLEQRLSDTDTGRSSLARASSSTSGLTAFHEEIRDRTSPETIHGGSLKTWTYNSPYVERVNVVLDTQGRPLDADLELWQGPDNTPQKVRVYVENGSLRPFSCTLDTPRSPNTIAIRNTAQLELPMSAHVVADTISSEDREFDMRDDAMSIQGGALRSYPFDCNVESVQVLLKSDGRPLNARIELIQGPNTNKQVIELYSENGSERPFYAVLETPGSANVVRIVNSAPVEFPLTAWVEPYLVDYTADQNSDVLSAVIGGDIMASLGW